MKITKSCCQPFGHSLVIALSTLAVTLFFAAPGALAEVPENDVSVAQESGRW